MHFHVTLQLYNSLIYCARELFKPWKDLASLVVCNGKIFRFWVFVGDVISWARLSQPKWLKTYPTYDVTHKKPEIQNLNFFHCKLDDVPNLSRVWAALNTLASGQKSKFLKKKHRNARGFAWEFLWSNKCYGAGRSVKRRCKSSSLHSKKVFWLGLRVFCEWCHKWRAFRPPWPTLPGLGPNR